MRRDATASKCFVQLVGNRKLAGDMALERPSLPASELVSFQNYAGLRGRTRAGRPYPAFHGMRKSSTSGFDFADCGMLGGSRPGPVNRHGFGVAGRAGARLAPITGPAPAGWPLSEWRPAPRKLNGGRLDSRCPEAAGEEGGGVAAARWARPAGRIGHRGASRPVPASVSAAAAAKVFPKFSLHRRPSSRIVLLRTGA
mgnify:FL=1